MGMLYDLQTIHVFRNPWYYWVLAFYYYKILSKYRNLYN